MSKFFPKPPTTFKAAALLAASLAALVALAPARPQAGGRSTSLDAPVARTATAAPCPGESVRLSGVIHLIVGTKPGPGGATHTVEGFDLRDARGAGETSGAAYRFEAVADGRRSIPCGPSEHCAAKALIAFRTSGDGPDSNLRGRLIVAVHERPGGALAAELVEFKFICPQ